MPTIYITFEEGKVWGNGGGGYDDDDGSSSRTAISPYTFFLLLSKQSTAFHLLIFLVGKFLHPTTSTGLKRKHRLLRVERKNMRAFTKFHISIKCRREFLRKKKIPFLHVLIVTVARCGVNVKSQIYISPQLSLSLSLLYANCVYYHLYTPYLVVVYAKMLLSFLLSHFVIQVSIHAYILRRKYEY